MRRFPATILLSLLFSSPALADISYHLTDIGTFGGTWSEALGINNKGQVVGGASRGNGIRRAFLYDDGVMIDMGSLFGESGESIAAAINERGQLAGQRQTAAQYYYAVRYDSDRIVYIGALPAGDSSP
jgi:probable HAF family extracellular repeat protein